IADCGAPQDDQRVGIPMRRPIDSLLPYGCLPRLRVRMAWSEGGLGAVALEHLNPQLGQNRFGSSPVVIPAAVPLRVGSTPLLQFRQGSYNIPRTRSSDDRNDPVHEIRIADRPLECLISAI